MRIFRRGTKGKKNKQKWAKVLNRNNDFNIKHSGHKQDREFEKRVLNARLMQRQTSFA